MASETASVGLQSHLPNALPAMSGIPTWVLSPGEKNKILSERSIRARNKCPEELRAFTECARGRSISTVWSCRQTYKDLRDCMAPFLTDEAFDEIYEEFMKAKADAAKKS
ncbi:hypothetical protein CANCADRAFT_45384 [Tortispora caseinolytica NRRL Y-17796]|uniref:COX assembly mitochondrial protein n=1 Tax=Tortispora caseinolytica NRRL Y-17796 TaxID=767744 RepID=A0A1E4TB76_9ASCO|nr:hypothetical protein CANCADRAFT_45384 [Tortispora caseinolytica NRRL Y-17796]